MQTDVALATAHAPRAASMHAMTPSRSGAVRTMMSRGLMTIDAAGSALVMTSIGWRTSLPMESRRDHGSVLVVRRST
jgi:hypothetical protein